MQVAKSTDVIQQKSPIRILLVEDNADDVVLINAALASATTDPYEMQHAGSLADGIAALAASTADIVVLDLGLPDSNGLATLQRMLSQPQHVPVVVLTGLSDEITGLRAVQMGAQDFLAKQFIVSHLPRAIRYAIERRRADEALRRTEEQFRQAQKLEAIGQLAGGVAHDFRNQLTVIRGFTELLEQDSTLSDNARSAVCEIMRAVERSTALTGQLLAFSRRRRLTAQPVDLNLLISEMSGSLSKMLGEDIRVVTLRAEEPCVATCDAGELHQTLLNLASNARDAMPKGGELKLATTIVAADSPIIRGLAERSGQDHIAVHVSDTGIGMDEKTRLRIFEPFFTTKPVGQGTGLGLAMVYGFIKQSGGFITVDSKPGGGTTVHLYLPRTATPASSPRAAAAPNQATRPPCPGAPPSTRGTGTILLVEDEEGLRKVAVASLSKQGYTLYAADRPAKALELLKRERIALDLLVTDMVMPGGSGLDLAHDVLEIYPKAGVLFISGYAEHDLASRDLTEVPGAFLLKPFGLKQLADSVRSAMPKRQEATAH